jgi:hypothetical protein
VGLMPRSQDRLKDVAGAYPNATVLPADVTVP